MRLYQKTRLVCGRVVADSWHACGSYFVFTHAVLYMGSCSTRCSCMVNKTSYTDKTNQTLYFSVTVDIPFPEYLYWSFSMAPSTWLGSYHRPNHAFMSLLDAACCLLYDGYRLNISRHSHGVPTLLPIAIRVGKHCCCFQSGKNIKFLIKVANQKM